LKLASLVMDKPLLDTLVPSDVVQEDGLRQ
jgi:hypothetical protein